MRPIELSQPETPESPEVVMRSHGPDALAINWGMPHHIGSAAYWVELTRYAIEEGAFSSERPHRLGETLEEELVACLLGGFGVTYEMGLAAFERLRSAGVLSSKSIEVADVRDLLLHPLQIGSRVARYRFPNQRATRVVAALRHLRGVDLPLAARDVRDALLEVPGVGPKTASWIVRNQYDSDDVAIIDIHVMRAARAASVFLQEWNPQSHYAEMEDAFGEWAHRGAIPARHLDAVIWSQQATLSRRR